VILGGADNDTIVTTDGGKIILGDSGVVNLVDVWGEGTDVYTVDPDVGGSDTIVADAGESILLGGAKGDTITGGSDRDVILGDNGRVYRNAGHVVTKVETASPAVGGADTIRARGGDDLVLGGADGDFIYGGEGRDVLLGDNGFVTYAAGKPGFISSSDPTLGGNDSIEGNGGEDIVIGGTGADTLSGDTGTADSSGPTDGRDIMMGDHGKVDLTQPLGSNATSIFTSAADGGGNDTMYGNGGDDLMMGQQGDDLMFGGDGSDDMIGGHNVAFGADGNDVMHGGAGADVMLGDNGLLVRFFNAATNDWLRDPAPFNDPIRQIVRFDDLDLVAGNDVMYGDGGADRMWGQHGNDTMYGGAGDDEMIGGLGNDTLSGDAGADVMLGDVGVISRATGPDGRARLNPDGSWHKDVLLTDVAYLSGSIALNGQSMPEGDQATVDALLNADVTLLTGVYNADGSKRYEPSGTPENRALLLNLIADGNDVMSGGDGNDAMYGQRGNDTLSGDAGNDFLSGGLGNDSLSGGDGNDTLVGDQAIVDSDWPAVPNVMHGYLVVRSAGSVDGAIGIDPGALGTTIVPMVSVVPGRETNAVSQMLPHIFGYGMVPDGNQLNASDGGYLVPFASVVTDWSHHAALLSGNDALSGGAGDDTLVGDDLVANARTVVFDAGTMDEAEYLTRRVLDVSDDFSDLVHAQFDLLGCHFGQWGSDWHDHWDERWGYDGYFRIVIDKSLSFGNDSLDGGAGNDVLIGDNSTAITPAFGVPSDLADRFEEFVEGATAAGDEIANGITDFAYLEHHLRDKVVGVKIGSKTYQVLEGHVDELLTGNDTLSGGDGNDLIVGDAFVYRAPTAMLLPNLGVGDGHQHFWHDRDHDHSHDWQDYGWGWTDGGHGERWNDHGDDHSLDAILTGRDTIYGGAGNDLVWGDSLALLTDNVVRSWGIGNEDFSRARGEAQEALDTIGALTDATGYWFGGDHGRHDLSQDGSGWWYGRDHGDSGDHRHWHDYDGLQFADTIYGGDGNDILFGQDGNDQIFGEKGDDWLIGGRDSDTLNGGTDYRERNRLYSGGNSSSDLRGSIAAAMSNWDGAFLSLALPGAPFGNTVLDRGENDCLDDFDFIKFACPAGLSFQDTETFTDGVANLFTAAQSGIWSVVAGRYNAAPAAAGGSAMSVMDLGLNSNQSMSLLELSTKVNVQGKGGYIFDYYGPDYFKFAAIDAPADKVLIGHYSAAEGWVIDASASRSIAAGYDYAMGLSLVGNLASVTLNGVEVLGHAYGAVAMHGKVGLYVNGGAGSFDNVTVKSNDPAFRHPVDYMLAESAPSPDHADTVTLTDAQLAPIVAAAIDAWTVKLGAGDERLAALSGLQVSIADLPDLALGETLTGGRIVIDSDAAGHGWFVDLSPADAREFTMSGEADTRVLTGTGAAATHMDLVTVMMHEMGHVLGFEHGDAKDFAVMGEDLDPGVRYLVDELGYHADPDHPITDQDLLQLAAQAARHEQARQALGQPAFDWNSAPVAGAKGSIDWSSGPASGADAAGWDSGYSPYSPARPDKAAKNFSDFLVKGFDSLGSSLFGARTKDKR